MAEIQETPIGQSQLAQRFIEFVMMQAQQTSVFLGKIPNPVTGKNTQNLEAARLFIDQLEMLREKTRGNLGSEESEILNHILSDLRFGYVEAAGAPQKHNEEPEQKPVAEKESPKEHPSADKEESESKKKFSKNYGT